MHDQQRLLDNVRKLQGKMSVLKSLQNDVISGKESWVEHKKVIAAS